MSTLSEKIAAARAKFEATEPTKVPVEVDGEIVTVTFLPVLGEVWETITGSCPPRHGAVLDGNVGYNTDAVAARYPLDRITVDGEPVDEETWTDLLAVLTSPNRKNIASVLWGLNALDPAKRLREAGKASAS